MKKIYLLSLFLIYLGNGYSQRCISLGCAAANTNVLTDGTLPDSIASSGLGCNDGNDLKQIFWEYFFSPSGGDFTQTFTPTSGTDLAINYVILDQGTTAPTTIACPVNTTGWTAIACDQNDHTNQPTGPGLFGVTATTTAGHYYAVAIIIWQGISTGDPASYTFDTNVPQLGGVDLNSGNCPGILPVNLSSFTGDVTNCMVNLNWVAESQTSFKNYEVQYSTDGTNFKTMSTIAGLVQGANQKYSYQHISPAAGNNYYRLKMKDIDGKFQYSKIISLKSDCNRSILFVYPNPVKNVLYINIPDLQTNITIAHLYNSSGKMIYSGEMQNGINDIDMSKFAQGIYLLKLKNNSGIQNIKLIK